MYLTETSNNIFVCYVILFEGTFYYFAICMCISVTLRVNGTVQFTLTLVMRLNIRLNEL